MHKYYKHKLALPKLISYAGISYLVLFVLYVLISTQLSMSKSYE